MIKLIHRYKQSIGIIFLFVALCFAVSGVGVDMMQGRNTSERHAIEVDDETFTYRDVQQAERRLENQYRSMFGQNYNQLAQSFGLNLTRQAIDNLIDSHLVLREAERVGFVSGEDEVREYIRAELFDPARGSGSFSPTQYRALLQNMGMSAAQFEAQVKQDLVRTAFTRLLNDVSFVSHKDVEERVIRRETKYSVAVARYTAGSLIGEVAEPSEPDLRAYYDANATDYELPARAQYEYAVLDPKDFERDVPASPQDIEFTYSENPSRFTTAEQARIRSIKVLYPKEADPSKMASSREKAKKAHDEAVAGKPFESLVNSYSDDLPTKLAGGMRGWVEKGKGSQAFDKAVFDAPAGGVAALIEEDWGFEIVKVEEKKSSSQRQLDDVRGEIEAEIKKREAPAYAAAKAQELLVQLRAPGTSFAEVVKNAGITVETTEGLVEAAKDPGLKLTGLTRKILDLPIDNRLSPTVIDLGDSSVLVQVKDFKDPETAPFEQVRAKVVETVKLREAKKIAGRKAQELLEAAKASDKGLRGIAEERKASVSDSIEITRANPTSPQLAGVPDELKDAVFKVTRAPSVLDRVFEAGEVFLVAHVTAIQKPDLSSTEMQSKLEQYRSEATQEAARTIMESTVARLKAGAAIDIDETLLVR